MCTPVLRGGGSVAVKLSTVLTCVLRVSASDAEDVEVASASRVEGGLVVVLFNVCKEGLSVERRSLSLSLDACDGHSSVLDPSVSVTGCGVMRVRFRFFPGWVSQPTFVVW